MNQGPTDYEIIAELCGKAMMALITIDPEQEWTMEEIAGMAVDQGLLVYTELKRRKNERQEKNGIDKSFKIGRSAPVPGVNSRRDS